MGQEMENMHQMLQRVSQSMEARDLQIKEFEAQVRAYDAETKRISATAAGMTPEQIQDIVMGTIQAAVQTGDLSPGMPQMAPAPEMPQHQMPPELMAQPPEMTDNLAQ
jgi:hypothetical protein